MAHLRRSTCHSMSGQEDESTRRGHLLSSQAGRHVTRPADAFLVTPCCGHATQFAPRSTIFLSDPSSVSQGLDSSICQDRKLISMRFGANSTVFGVKWPVNPSEAGLEGAVQTAPPATARGFLVGWRERRLSKPGTYKTVKARFWPWLSGKRPSTF